MERLERLRWRLAEQSIDLLCLGPGAHLKWLLGLTPHADERPLLFCVSQRGEGFLIPALEANSLRQHTDKTFYAWDDAEGPRDAFARLLEDISVDPIDKVALDETMRADFAGLVQNLLPNAEYQFSTTSVGALRACKDDGEYRVLKKNARIADQAMQAAFKAIKPEMREVDIQQVINNSFVDQGAVPLFGIVGAGRNAAFPHHQTGTTTLQVGDPVLMDIGATIDGYSSDITRMAVIGDAPEGFEECHAIVDNALKAALSVARPGISAKQVDKAARDVITQAGYGEYFMHRTGHGLGVEIHEPPYITASASQILEEGIVFSIEPGIYLPNRFGIRLEEIVILRKSGPEVLSEIPRDIVRIDA